MATTRELNDSFIRLAQRAELNSRENLVTTFVDNGTLEPVLTSRNHTILYGRRGTGKTHALTFLSQTVRSRGDVAISIDLRTIDSSGSLYSDPSLSLSERALGLISDVISEISKELTREAVFLSDSVGLDLGSIGVHIDSLAASVRDVRISGEVRASKAVERMDSNSSKVQGEASLSKDGPKLSVGGMLEDGSVVKETVNEERSGLPILHIEFGNVAGSLRSIIDSLGSRTVWLIIDEWSAVPMNLQPYLADLLRRTCLAVPNCIVKIAAIEHRSRIFVSKEEGGYIGLEPGADISIAVSLDDFLVFDNDQDRSRVFFQNLIYKHIISDLKDKRVSDVPASSDQLISQAYTNSQVFDEVVRAAEGVPRDAFNILGLAAQRSGDAKIQMETLREVARSWYERDKEQAIRANESLQRLLDWIIGEVIGSRKARAFLIEVGASKDPIDRLFDARILHILKKNVSSAEGGGLRYDVYKLDFGCYIHLMKGASAPQGLLPFDADEKETTAKFIEVPPDDYRSIRRAILDLDDFTKAQQKFGT